MKIRFPQIKKDILNNPDKFKDVFPELINEIDNFIKSPNRPSLLSLRDKLYKTEQYENKLKFIYGEDNEFIEPMNNFIEPQVLRVPLNEYDNWFNNFFKNKIIRPRQKITSFVDPTTNEVVISIL